MTDEVETATFSSGYFSGQFEMNKFLTKSNANLVKILQGSSMRTSFFAKLKASFSLSVIS